MKKWMAITLLLCLFFGLGACGAAPPPHSTGQIYLVGEAHGEPHILQRELELWVDYYHNQGLRHLFIEQDYYIGEYLNLWMKADNDDILNDLFTAWTGTVYEDNPHVWDFFQRIKADCPETVFHGTDIGLRHTYAGPRYLAHLLENGLRDSEQYRLTIQCLDQGTAYRNRGDTYRENTMTENFIRAFDALEGESIMGIYGAAHTGLDNLAFYGEVDCMGTRLVEIYGDAVHSEDLSVLPIRIDTITVAGKEYQASYYGKIIGGSWNADITAVESWRLEGAYDDFKDIPKAPSYTTESAIKVAVESGQVFVIDLTLEDGTVERRFGRTDGSMEDDGTQIIHFFDPN